MTDPPPLQIKGTAVPTPRDGDVVLDFGRPHFVEAKETAIRDLYHTNLLSKWLSRPSAMASLSMCVEPLYLSMWSNLCRLLCIFPTSTDVHLHEQGAFRTLPRPTKQAKDRCLGVKHSGLLDSHRCTTPQWCHCLECLSIMIIIIFYVLLYVCSIAGSARTYEDRGLHMVACIVPVLRAVAILPGTNKPLASP